MKIKANIHDAVHNPSSPRSSLVISKSDIEGAGNGLFSNEFIREGSPICEYKGDLCSMEDIRVLADEGKDSYILLLEEPHLVGLNGQVFIGINADPDHAQEVGYGGFANDRYTDYPKTILDLEKELKKAKAKLTAEHKDYIESLDWNKRIPKEDSRKIKKWIKPISRISRKLYEEYVSHGYNAVYERLKGLPSFLLIALKDIYPGDEIFVPYGPIYWTPKDKKK